jgi:ribosomal protein L11 methyltransferase
MYYTRLTVGCKDDFREMLLAEIADAGFDTFMETETGFEAYAEQESYDQPKLDELKNKYVEAMIVYRFDRIEKKNWNEEWEKNYEPILVEGKCLIRAEFHVPERKYPFEIIITPKMSFGTGHHQTTYLMIQSQLAIDHKNKRVMDAGCGTAILSVMASKLGAREVEAFDIDEWSVINGAENIQINQCPNIHLQQGKISELSFSGSFDIVLANINKNVLLEEIRQYSSLLDQTGCLLLSGFYEQDISDLLNEAARYQLKELSRSTREGWASLLLRK